MGKEGKTVGEVEVRPANEAVACLGGLGWVGLGWVGLGWVGLGWVGLGWVGLGWVGLGWVGLGWVGLGWVGLGWVGLGWVGLGWVGLGWVGLGGWVVGRTSSRFDVCLVVLKDLEIAPIVAHHHALVLWVGRWVGK